MKLDPERPPESDDYYMGIALAVRRRANCKGRRVGAVLVKNNRIISTGYNGVPEGMTNCLDGGCYRCTNPNGQFKSGKGYDLCICVHAEQNALLAAARFGISVEGAHLYTTMQPCYGCAKELIQAHIECVTYVYPWHPNEENHELQEALRKEYQNILNELQVRHIQDFEDPGMNWANDATAKKLAA